MKIIEKLGNNIKNLVLRILYKKLFKNVRIVNLLGNRA